MEGLYHYIIMMVCVDQSKREETGYRNKLQAPQVMALNKTSSNDCTSHYSSYDAKANLERLQQIGPLL